MNESLQLIQTAMACRKSNGPKVVPCTWGRNRFQTTLPWFALLVVVLVPAMGCQQLPGSQAMRQYQLESDRLVNEFRAQKKRAEELEARNVQLEQRLAESEKLLARAQNSSGRRAGRNGTTTSELLIGDANDSGRSSSLSSSNSSRTSASRTNRVSTLPDAVPSATGTASRFTSSGSRDLHDLRGDPNRESEWRPLSSPSR